VGAKESKGSCSCQGLTGGRMNRFSEDEGEYPGNSGLLLPGCCRQPGSLKPGSAAWTFNGLYNKRNIMDAGHNRRPQKIKANNEHSSRFSKSLLTDKEIYK